MKYIIVIDGALSTRYKYNVWSCFEYEDGSVSQDTRIFESDKKDQFLDFLSNLKGEEVASCQIPTEYEESRNKERNQCHKWHVNNPLPEWAGKETTVVVPFGKGYLIDDIFIIVRQKKDGRFLCIRKKDGRQHSFSKSNINYFKKEK